MWRNFCPLFFTMLLSSLRFTGSYFCLGHCCTLILVIIQKHSLEDFLLCLGSLSCSITQFGPSFSWFEVLLIICCVSKNVVLCIIARHLQFGLFCIKNIIPKVLWFFQTQLCKPKPCYHLLFREKRFSPGNPSTQATLVQAFTQSTVRNFNIQHVNWGLAEAEIERLGFLLLLLALHGLTLGWICWRKPLLGRLLHRVNARLNAQYQQNATASAFAKLLTLADCYIGLTRVLWTTSVFSSIEHFHLQMKIKTKTPWTSLIQWNLSGT